MEITKSDIVSKIRTAIDDILSVSDSFSTDTDNELWQATWHAVESLQESLPLDMLTPKADATYYANGQHQTTNTDGSGYLSLENDFVRFVSLSLLSWNGRIVTELLEPGSDEALRQTNKWSRGTVSKPRAMLDHDASGNKILRYWSAGKSNDQYNHSVAIMNYIPKATMTGTTITSALRDIAERQVVYQAAAIFFEGKKESVLADKFRNL